MKTPTRPKLRLIGKTPIRLIILLSLLSAFPIHLLRWEKPHQPVSFLHNRSSIREQILNNKMRDRTTLRLLYRPCNQQFAGFKSDSNSFLAVQTLQIKPTNRWLTLKLSKVINILSQKWILYRWEFVSSDTSVLYFALMGIIYGGVYIGQVSRHYVAYTRVTRATWAH